MFDFYWFGGPKPLDSGAMHQPSYFPAYKHCYLFRVHKLLVALGISHFLCYGSLWGQLRLSRTLPWERDIELCVLNEEMALKDEVG